MSADGFLRLWNVKLVQLVAEVQVSQDSGLTAVCVDPAQTHLVLSDSAGFMYTYTIAAWKGGKGKSQVHSPPPRPPARGAPPPPPSGSSSV